MATIGTVEGTLRLRDEFTRTLKGANEELGRSTKQISRIGESLRRLGGVVVAALGTRELVQFSRTAIEAALRFEALDQKLAVAAGSAAGAAAEMEFVRKTVDALGLDLVSTAEGFAKFSVALKGTSLEGEASRDIFTSVAKASAVMRLSAEETAGVMTALEQIVSKGTVSAEELRGQLGERLPGAFRFAAEAMNVTTQELGKLLQQGELTAEDLLPRLAQRLEQEFGAAAVEAAQSGQAAFNRFNTAMFDLRAVIGEQLLPTFTDMAKEIATFAASDEARQTAADLASTMSELASAVFSLVQGLRALNELLRPLSDAMNRFAGALPDPERLRAVADAIDRIARIMSVGTRDAAELTDRMRDYAATLMDQQFQDAFDKVVPPDLPERLNQAAGGVSELGNTAESLNEDLEQLESTSTDAAAAISTLGEESRDAFRDVVDAMNEPNRLTEQGEQQIRDTLAEANKGTIEWADSLGTVEEILDRLREELDLTVPEIEDQNQAVADQAAEWIQVGQAAAQAFREIDDDVGQVIQAVVAMTAAMIAFDQATKAAAQTVAILNIAMAAFAVFAALAGGGRRTQRTPPIAIGPGGAQTGDLSEEFGFSVDSVREAFGEFLDAFNSALRETMQAISLVIPETMEPVFFEFEKVFKDGQLRFVRVIIDGVTESFETAEEAIGFALQKFLQATLEVGAEVDEAVRQIIEGFAGDPAQFQDVLRRVQGLADQAAIAIDGLSSIELELRKLPASIQALEMELTQLGLSADQVARLTGGELVASFQALRQQITGEQLSLAERRKIAQAQAELFNAELELQIARLEAERDALLAEAGLSQQQIALLNADLSVQAKGLQARGEIARGEAKLTDNVIDARSAFVKASGQVFQAEAGVMAGFVQAGTGLVRVGLEAVGSFVDVIGQLSPEIAKQVQAIQNVINALRKIRPIRPGDIRIPGVPGAPGGRPGRRPGGGPAPRAVDPFAALQGLLDRLFPLRAALRDLRADADLLRQAFEAGKISQRDYQRGIELINEEMALLRTERLRGRIMETLDGLLGLADEIGARIEQFRNALEGLAEFRAGLLTGPLSALAPGQRLAEAESQFREAVLRAQEGDASAIADVQRLAQQFLQLQAEFGGTATAGFTRAFNLVRDLTEDVLTEGNELVETELENLQDINNQIADLLESNREVAEALGLTQEDIAEIRRRGIPAEEATRDSIDDLRREQDRSFRRVSRLLENLIQALAS